MTPFPIFDRNFRGKFRGPYICRQDIYLSDTAYKCHRDENDEHNLGKSERREGTQED
jgi:hypothetical protein